MGAHVKTDYLLDNYNKLALYAGYMQFDNAQVRDAYAETEQTIRLRWQRQNIANASLMGEHHLLNNHSLGVKWAANIAEAQQKTPDNTQLQLNHNTAMTSVWVNKNVGAIRRWERNADKDMAAHLDLDYMLPIRRASLNIAAGGMYRNKKRDSHYHEYTFQPYNDMADNLTASYDQFRGNDWNNYE